MISNEEEKYIHDRIINNLFAYWTYVIIHEVIKSPVRFKAPKYPVFRVYWGCSTDFIVNHKECKFTCSRCINGKLKVYIVR